MPSKDAGVAVLGVSFAAGDAYLALVKGPDQYALGDPVRLSVPENLSTWPALRQFASRLVADAAAHGVGCVAFAEPRKYGAWKYYDAFNRAAMQTAASLALYDAGIAVHAIAQRTACATIGLALGALDDQLAAKLGIEHSKVLHWKQRVPALAVAIHIARRPNQ
jgi:hypothetical protein